MDFRLEIRKNRKRPRLACPCTKQLETRTLISRRIRPALERHFCLVFCQFAKNDLNRGLDLNFFITAIIDIFEIH